MNILKKLIFGLIILPVVSVLLFYLIAIFGCNLSIREYVSLKIDNRCVECDLTGADLSGWDLTGANLTGSNFTKANLSGAFLYKTNFAKSTFDGTIFKVKKLSTCSFYGALFENINFGNQKISKSDFTNAHLNRIVGRFYKSDQSQHWRTVWRIGQGN